jgi:hypothetical protein
MSRLRLLSNPHVTLHFAFYSPIMPAMTDERHGGAPLLVAASLIAAIRLRGEPIKPSPKLQAVIHDSVQLAVMLLRQIQGHSPFPPN